MISYGRVLKVSAGPDGIWTIRFRLKRSFDERQFWTADPWIASLCERLKDKPRLSLQWEPNHQVTGVGLPVTEQQESA